MATATRIVMVLYRIVDTLQKCSQPSWSHADSGSPERSESSEDPER